MQGNYRLTAESADTDVRHVILDFGGQPFPVLEGQSLGVIPPGVDAGGKPHLPRLYSVSSPRDGERPNNPTFQQDVGERYAQVSQGADCEIPSVPVECSTPTRPTLDYQFLNDLCIKFRS